MQVSLQKLKDFIATNLRNGNCPYYLIAEKKPPKFVAAEGGGVKRSICAHLGSTRDMAAQQVCWDCWGEAIGLSERFTL